MTIDAQRRFTPTPLEQAYQLQGATVAVATNSQALLNRLSSVLMPSSRCHGDTLALLWRVVVEEIDVAVDSLSSHRVSQNGLALVNFGQQNFLALDVDARQGASFVSNKFISNESLFRQYFLSAFFSLVNEFLASRGR